MELLKLFTVSEFTALSGSRFQSLIVRGKNELYFTVCGDDFDLFIMSRSWRSCVESYVICGGDRYQAIGSGNTW